MIVRVAAALGAALILSAAVAHASPKTMTVTMRAENKSGETGTARLMQLPNGVQIKIALNGAPKTAQPAHIHQGTSCQKLNPAPAAPLTDVVDGTSTTFLKGKKISDFMGGYVINVHMSAADLPTYVSCGAIK